MMVACALRIMELDSRYSHGMYMHRALAAERRARRLKEEGLW
jgi:hypothetical protein